LLALASSDNEKYASSPGREHIGDWKKFQHERGKEQGMEPDEPPDENHRGDIQKFVHKGPAQRTEKELDSVDYHSDRVGTPDAISSQERYLDQLLEKFEHLSDEYTVIHRDSDRVRRQHRRLVVQTRTKPLNSHPVRSISMFRDYF